jgi:hypothetical protein
MHDQRLNPQHLSSTEDLADREFDQQLTRALEMAPEPAIPADFYARLASRLPAKPPLPAPPLLPQTTHYGQSAIWISMVVLLAVLLASAHTVSHSTFALTLQWTLCAQFVLLAVWLSTRRHLLR